MISRPLRAVCPGDEDHCPGCRSALKSGRLLHLNRDWKESGGLDRNSAFMVRCRVSVTRRKYAMEHHSGVRRRRWSTIHDYAGHHRTARREYDCGKPWSQSAGIEADCESVARHRSKATAAGAL